METIAELLAGELGRTLHHVENVIALIDEGNTIPFIARYRKEMHGSMDDDVLRTLEERLKYLRNLEERREEIKQSILAQDKLTEEIVTAIAGAKTLAELEDIYRPFKQKRRTRATMAREKGLLPLAEVIFAQEKGVDAPENLAGDFINPDLGVETLEDALAGASDIIAEWVSEDAALRKKLRLFYLQNGDITSKNTKEEDSVYRLYYAFSQKIGRMQGHQVLALNRGEKEEFLRVGVVVEKSQVLAILKRHVIIPGTKVMGFLQSAVEDAYDRLLAPSMERELRTYLTENAADGAIKTFAMNLKPLLLQPPVKGKVTLGLDPAYRTGCKIAVVDDTGKVLDHTVIYPTAPHHKVDEGKKVLKSLVKKHNVSLISIGNGTASRESEQFVAEFIREENVPLSYAVVNEAGASVYSASKLAAAEFPDYDVTVRSAVSIARRLQDPLAELVKIDPKSIGVGQYQHDMPQNKLDESLVAVVEDCVNGVGVDVNTASSALLLRVAGLSATTAKNIVTYREENGAFQNRKAILKVPKLGPKSYLQCAGFLRVLESKEILDHTAVHPESYKAAEKLLTLCGYTKGDVKEANLGELTLRVKEIGAERAAEFCEIGVPTLEDLVKELQKPGRDMRLEMEAPLLRTDVMEMKDLKPEMVLSGTVRNVIDFGVFVDIGVHQDGLVHISQLTNRFVKHPSEVVSVGDIVKVKVLEVDVEKKRISLTMKGV